MRIKMKTIMAGPDGVFDIGTIIDMPKVRAIEFIRAGYAERHASDEEIVTLPELPEAAAIEHEAETGTMPAARKRKGG